MVPLCFLADWSAGTESYFSVPPFCGLGFQWPDNHMLGGGKAPEDGCHGGWRVSTADVQGEYQFIFIQVTWIISIFVFFESLQWWSNGSCHSSITEKVMSSAPGSCLNELNIACLCVLLICLQINMNCFCVSVDDWFWSQCDITGWLDTRHTTSLSA